MELEKLFEKIYTPVAPLTGKCYASDEPLDYAKRESGTPIDVDGDTKWTDRRFGCGWFHLTGSIPDDCRGRHVVLLIDLGGEISKVVVGVVTDRPRQARKAGTVGRFAL